VRIIAGDFRGRRLASVGKGDSAAHLRPTQDRVRESLFNQLTGGRFGNPIIGARVLDLFAGTGALGLEALSRGAATVTFVENGAKSTALIRENINICHAADNTKLHRRDATKLSPNPDAPYDLVFLDPPYAKSMGERALKSAIANDWLAVDALVIWEESAKISPPKGLTLLDDRRYGDTVISILRWGP